ncbi:MAG: pre-peptidase C-terminal domain-containing protein, partial [Planctomycetaceae bacterium]|nr:pre-peptidase C-terminal domain-containing protein [Planctomycetaceae bacterium]
MSAKFDRVRRRRTPGCHIQCLENRVVLSGFNSAFDSLDNWFQFNQQEDGLFLQKGETTKPYIVGEVDIVPILGAVAGGIGGAGVGVLPGYLAGKLTSLVGGSLKGFVAVDALDLIGRASPTGPWLTTDAAEDYVTIVVGTSAGFSAGIGLSDLIGGSGSIAFLPVQGVNSEPSFNGLRGFNEIRDLGGLFGGNISSEIVSVTFAEITLESVRVEIRRENLLGNIDHLTFGPGLIASLVEDVITGRQREVTVDDTPRPISPPTASLPIADERHLIYVDGSRDQTFQVTAQTDGNLLVSVIGLDRSFGGALRLFDFSGVQVGANNGFNDNGNPTLVYTHAQAGKIYYLNIAGIGSPHAGSISVTQPPNVPIDPFNHPLPFPVVVDDAPDRFEDAAAISLASNGSATRSGIIDGNNHATGDSIDHDWYVVTAKIDGPMEIKVSGLDANVRVHGPDSKTLKVDSDENPAVALIDVRAGQTFRIDVGPRVAGVTGRYTLNIHQPLVSNLPPSPPVVDDQVPWLGNVPRTNINLTGGTGHSNGSIDDPFDVKWFQINGPSAGNMVVQVLPVNDDLKPFVAAFRSNGGGIDTDTGEFDGEAKVGFTVAANEIIIVAVSSHAGRSTGGFTINVSQPASLPDDDVNDFGEPARNLGPEITQEGDGSFDAKIETPDDNDWFEIPIRGSGYLSIDITPRDSGIIPFLELSNDGTSNGFYETDAGYDGHAHISFLPAPGQTSVWAKVSSADGTQGAYTLTTWRTQNPEDDYPDAGGVFLPSRELAPGGQIFIAGRIDNPGDSDNFHIRVDQPGPVAVQIISLTDGFKPFFSRARQSSDPTQRTGTSGSDSGRGGRAFEIIPGILPANDNWLVIDVKAGLDSTVPFGDYIVQVWQPGSDADKDADTVGIEASPVLVNGSGNGILPGNPNGGAVAPSIDYAGDKDVFQVVAAANRPITISVDGTAINNGTFLRIYDSSGRAVATDYNSGPSNSSQITLDANRGDLFYVEVSAYDGSSTGAYTVQVSQAQDDHPDRANFTHALGQTWDSTPIILDP